MFLKKSCAPAYEGKRFDEFSQSPLAPEGWNCR